MGGATAIHLLLRKLLTDGESFNLTGAIAAEVTPILTNGHWSWTQQKGSLGLMVRTIGIARTGTRIVAALLNDAIERQRAR